MPVPAGAQGSGRTVLLTLTEGASLTQVADTVGALGGRVLATLELSDSLLVELPTGVGAPAGSAEIPDTPMTVNGTRTADAAKRPTYKDTIDAPQGVGVGRGVTVALVDTGVADVPDLAAVVHLPVNGVGKAGDGLGHGTFLAGIIGGVGPTFSGVAPGATLLDVQVATKRGATSLSKVLQGLEIAAEHKADVVNISLSTESPLPPSYDPLSLALQRLWAAGVTVVTAAGNDGPETDSVGSPGNDPTLLTVGALDEAGSSDRRGDSVARFSARGDEHSVAKPDLVAPGVSLVSTAAPDSSAYAENPDSHVGDAYMLGSGTSMSAALVAGGAAAVLAANPLLTPDGVKSLLMATAYRLDDSEGAGAGALDLGKAVTTAAEAPLDPAQPVPAADPDAWGPDEEDAELWAVFAAAWESGDFKAAKAAWGALTWRTQQWASRGWMLSVLADSVGKGQGEFTARSWAARSWAIDGWLARSWAARSWAARSWAYEEWLARSWADLSWSARSWAARSWASDEWLARSWAARSWAARSWAARSWADEDWAARSWAARSWATQSWDTSSWSMAN
ncbi:MAG TPA: S8 family serine peptidase [Motilibacterales bacterium]|nr:S8 family serine peptidase [Motilibacterales bacterium]